TLALIEELKGILASDAKLMAIIRKDLLAIKEEYGDARRTEIVAETTELTIEDLLADEEMVVTITRSGYIKRTHVEAYRSQRRGGKGVTGMETKEELEAHAHPRAGGIQAIGLEDRDRVITARHRRPAGGHDRHEARHDHPLLRGGSATDGPRRGRREGHRGRGGRRRDFRG